RCTWPTSLPRFSFVWKIVRAGVHDQLWQRFFWKGMWKKQPSALSFQLSVRTHVFPQALKHARQPLIPLIPVVSARNHMELVSKIPALQQCSKIAIRRQQPFLFTAGQKQVRRPCRVDGSSEHKGIA